MRILEIWASANYGSFLSEGHNYIMYDYMHFVMIIYRCTPFPHHDLLCGQYIDHSTTVYIDDSVFNYTEANNRIIELDNNEIFRTGELTSCRWIVIYMICLSVYPQCNTETQALVPPCKDECLKYIDNVCSGNLALFHLSTVSFQLDEKLILDCSDPFRVFDSVHADVENCYNFTCKLIQYSYRVLYINYRNHLNLNFLM